MGTFNKKAILISFTAEKWPGTKTDEKAERVVDAFHNTKRKGGRYVKNLVDYKESGLNLIANHIARMRKVHQKWTLCWIEDGKTTERLLPASLIPKYQEEMLKLEMEFDRLVDNFIAEYPEQKRRAEYELGDLYKESDYPTIDELRNEFRLIYGKNVIPETMDNWYLDAFGENDSTKDEVVDTLQQRHANAMDTIVKRCNEALNNLKRAINDISDKENSRFHDCHIDKVRELVNLIPKFNYCDDEKITELGEKMKEIASFSPDLIKDDISKREEILNRIKEINRYA